MTQRTIHKDNRAHGILIKDALASLFALTILRPPEHFMLCSPWVDDIEVMDNRFGQYRALLPEAVNSRIRLSTLLNILDERGCEVQVICRPDEKSNDDFLARLPGVPVLGDREIHAKYMVCDYFCITGSMNFTDNGVHRDQQNNTEISTDPQTVSGLLLAASEVWTRLGGKSRG